MQYSKIAAKLRKKILSRKFFLLKHALTRKFSAIMCILLRFSSCNIRFKWLFDVPAKHYPAIFFEQNLRYPANLSAIVWPKKF